MKKQSYKNHVRYYVPHHFIFYPLMLALIGLCIGYATGDDNKLEWFFMALLFFSVIVLSFMLRQHYALTLQDRIVLLELRYRYYATTGQRLEPFEDKLSKGQLFALRFAPDEELDSLLQKAITEGLSADKIKQSVHNWKADNQRV